MDYIYTHVPAKAPKIDKKQRDAQIYERHLEGTTNDELAKRFDLSQKHIERILRKTKINPEA